MNKAVSNKFYQARVKQYDSWDHSYVMSFYSTGNIAPTSKIFNSV